VLVCRAAPLLAAVVASGGVRSVYIPIIWICIRSGLLRDLRITLHYITDFVSTYEIK